MHLLQLTLPTLPENLALDEALLLAAEANTSGEALRLWEWPAPAVVLGSGGRLAEEVDEGRCRTDEVPIFRRASGGGTVLLGRGCLLYSLVLAYKRAPALLEITSSYVYILGRVRDALTALEPGIEKAGVSDLVLEGWKVSGNAQQRKRNFLLHHGTILYRFDLELIGRYLRQPARQPDYRRDRSHGEFVVNLPAGGNELGQRLGEHWQADTELQALPMEKVQELTLGKYTQPEWIRRR